MLIHLANPAANLSGTFNTEIIFTCPNGQYNIIGFTICDHSLNEDINKPFKVNLVSDNALSLTVTWCCDTNFVCSSNVFVACYIFIDGDVREMSAHLIVQGSLKDS